MSFKELYGQEGLRHTLTGKLIAGRVSHAVLLCGPPGSGKKSWGLALARALLCSRREGAAPCGECASCRQFQTGGPPALFHLRPQGRRLGLISSAVSGESFISRVTTGSASSKRPRR